MDIIIAMCLFVCCIFSYMFPNFPAPFLFPVFLFFSIWAYSAMCWQLSAASLIAYFPVSWRYSVLPRCCLAPCGWIYIMLMLVASFLSHSVCSWESEYCRCHLTCFFSLASFIFAEYQLHSNTPCCLDLILLFATAFWHCLSQGFSWCGHKCKVVQH